jgi:predicted nucleotidyltransferase
MDINESFYIDFLKILNDYKVRYLLIGGYAVNLHGYSRYTGDLDIWSDPSRENSERLISVIDKFGFDTEILKGRDLLNESPIKLTEDILKIEILSSLVGGFTFEEAYGRSLEIDIEGLKFRLISFQDLIANKEKSMRMKDATDVYYLKEIKKIQDKKNEQN